VAAGVENELAGGGTLIPFPTPIFLGMPSIEANIRPELFVGAGFIGGVIGGILLLHAGECIFRAILAFLILLASGLLAIQNPLRRC
jgi:uncharacterized protein